MRSKYAWILGEKGRAHHRLKPNEGPEALKISQIITAIYSTLIFYCFICLIFLYERANGYIPRKLRVEFIDDGHEKSNILSPEIYH